MSAGGVTAARPAIQQVRGGAIPTPALQYLKVRPVPVKVVKALLVREHYLHSMPGGSQMVLGVYWGQPLLGAVILGAGPSNAHRLVHDATRDDCAALTRLWLHDDLPKNSESRVIGQCLRALGRYTGVKFVLSYADPAQGHVGTIYQATNWIYTGPSSAMPLYDIGDGVPRHSRTLSHAIGSHSMRHFADHGVTVQKIPQLPKHRYIYFLDRRWRSRMRGPELPYPKLEDRHASD